MQDGQSSASQTNSEPVTQPQNIKPLMKQMPKGNGNKHTMMLVVASLLVVIAGVGTGWLLSGAARAGDNDNRPSQNAKTNAKGDLTEAGLKDESLFEEETPEGILTEGGIEGEGTHYLDRGLGPEKNVYLTSTLLDLQGFVGKKVRVWGNTIAAQNAPWLMDVGKIKVIE